MLIRFADGTYGCCICSSSSTAQLHILRTRWNGLSTLPASLCVGNIPLPERDYNGGDPDTWAVAPHLAVTSHMAYLNENSNIAFEKATGWRKRLPDARGSRIVLTEAGKFPVVRTVCSDRVLITGS